METKKVTPEMAQRLRAPLPPEAVKPHPTKPYLSSIKAIFVTERLNQVFGIGSWKFKSVFVENAGVGMIVVYATLTIPEYDIELSSFGGNDNGGETNKNFDLGDAYKGATTDALTKICSWLEIGIDVFKGNKGAQPAVSNNQSNGAPAGEELPWLTEDKLKAMLATISTGETKTVLERMKNYRMKKEYRTQLDQAIKDKTK